jgi:mannose-6-phosphate isomerase-like protein (cupin superfamily)
MSKAPFRRIVTGHDARGRAVILEDGPPPRVARIGGEHGPLFFEVWNTRETPAQIDRASGEPAEESIRHRPGMERASGTGAPEDQRRQADARAAPARRGRRRRCCPHAGTGSRHAFMHRTETIDYGIVLEGEITLILDEGETVVRAGDIVIQRGTNHGWANRGSVPCRIAFILIDGQYDADLAR